MGVTPIQHLGKPNKPQIVDSETLKTMTPKQIRSAMEGRLNAILCGVDIRRGMALMADEWTLINENLTDSELVAADAQGLLEQLHQKHQPTTLRAAPT